MKSDKYLYLKTSCLFVLSVLFCFVCHVEISQTVSPPVTFLVSLESSQRGEVHGLGFVAFRPIVGKILNFKVIYEPKTLGKYFYFDFDCGNGTGHTTLNLSFSVVVPIV